MGMRTFERTADTDGPVARRPIESSNRTGIPDALKRGAESMSGVDLSDVRVRFNSSEPARLQAHAFARGSEIHLAPRREQSLPHEVWHLVQQRQGRVPTTSHLRGQALNTDAALEREADVMGSRALQHRHAPTRPLSLPAVATSGVCQRDAAQNLRILQGVPSTDPHDTYTHEGGKGRNIETIAEDDFVINGVGGTWHHIYPRNLLKANLANISRYLVATNGVAAQMTETATSHETIVNMAASFSMNAAGRLTKPAHYYWKDGNGFLGVRSDYRSDDPGSLVEHAKPKSMGNSPYQLPRDWGKELSKLSDALGDLGSLTNTDELASVNGNLNKLADNIRNMSWQLDSNYPYRSVDYSEGVDWARKSNTHAWGARVKNYVLVK